MTQAMTWRDAETDPPEAGILVSIAGPRVAGSGWWRKGVWWIPDEDGRWIIGEQPSQWMPLEAFGE